MMEKGDCAMLTGIQNRTQYLVLAEFCQNVISSLIDYINGTNQLQNVTLENVLRTLKSVEAGDPYRFGQRSAVALSSYEEVRTLEEVWTPAQIAEAITLTAELLADGGGDDAKKAKAEELLTLFSKLQTRALWHFEQPRQTSPPDLREICKALKTA
jgi:hypothetical protein